ncbi:S1 family peptidase [Hamadaea tsunoensis]|uniref:S1 family peptidase n=1 Tax=Hamadaea tsunoensis TaxID=53368 RepID=UPI000488D9E8|nr:serine protease [Hamadaea tsunoensis]
MTSVEVERTRVVQVVARSSPEHRYFGSGYLVTDSLALTASHVVAGARSVTVRTFLGDAVVDQHAEVLDFLPEIDVALLHLAIPARGVVGGRIPFGRLGESADPVACRIVGFPRFKLRTEQALGDIMYRDSHDARGRIAALSNLREGTIEVLVPPPAARTDVDHSPWEGFSGASVLVEGHVVGVVRQHEPNAPLACLTAVPVTRWYASLGGAARFDQLRTRLGLPWRAADLPDLRQAYSVTRVLRSLDHREYEEVISALSQAVGRSGAAREHYLLALALLRGVAPRRHRSTREIVDHLRLASTLPEARALHLLIDEDAGMASGRADGLPRSLLHEVVAAVPRPEAARICAQFSAPSSSVWAALHRRSEGGNT